MKMASPIPTSLSTDHPSIPTLTCESCRQRKVKCDKLNPCTNCQKAGINCESVRRRRLPRGRHINKSTSTSHNLHLQHKIDRLEALVNVALAGSSDTTNVNTTSPNGHAPDNSSSTVSGSAVHQFWDNLITEVHGPQDFTSEHAERESRADVSVSSSGNETKSTFTGLSLGGIQFHSLSLRPSPAVIAALCNVYLDQVDRIVKVLHRPSLKTHLLEGQPYPKGRNSINSENALDAAVFYAAVASMTDRQCRSLFHCDRATILPEYQKACEMSLERADLTRSLDVTVLQAFVLYLVCGNTRNHEIVPNNFYQVATRAHDKSRAVWTLVATAVRLAHALNLHIDSAHPSETFFNRQMRKRLWFTICLLDVQTCFDPDSRPLIPLEMVQTSEPLNLNDSDFDPSYRGTEPAERDEVTDMTFALITYRIQRLGRSMHLIKEGKGFGSTREELVAAFENDVYQLTKSCNPGDDTYSWFIYHGSRSLIASAQLFTVGPITETSSPTRPPCSILELSANTIENVFRIQNDERGEGFRWYIIPQWPAVALAIRECYVSSDFAAIRRVWPLVEEVFERYQSCNPCVNGRPQMIQKLMDNTRERVRVLIGLDSDNNISASDNFVSPLGETFSDAQAMNLVSPSWTAWENFVTDLMSGQDAPDERHDFAGRFFVKPDLVFPFGKSLVEW